MAKLCQLSGGNKAASDKVNSSGWQSGYCLQLRDNSRFAFELLQACRVFLPMRVLQNANRFRPDDQLHPAR
jgi:hypothetical protein